MQLFLCKTKVRQRLGPPQMRQVLTDNFLVLDNKKLSTTIVKNQAIDKGQFMLMTNAAHLLSIIPLVPSVNKLLITQVFFAVSGSSFCPIKSCTLELSSEAPHK